MFCSVIIPTIGRSTLCQAVQSVLDQRFTEDDFEVIVVNDSGRPLLEEDWQKSVRVRGVDTGRRERSVARNTGAAIARGEYLLFLDDDDWLFPSAFQYFWRKTRAGNGDLYYGGSQLIDRQGKPLIRLHHQLDGNCLIKVMAGEWVPMGAFIVKANAFFQVGGFNPLIKKNEDVDLLRKISEHWDFSGFPEIVACITMGEGSGSSTDYSTGSTFGRLTREAILSRPGVFRRLLASTCLWNWYGRLARIYLTSAVWNLQRHDLDTAVIRLFFSLLSFAFAGYRILLPSFWRELSCGYESETFRRGFAEAAL
jgi:glycosyltransferase involved in cell wall biosynthesis